MIVLQTRFKWPLWTRQQTIMLPWHRPDKPTHRIPLTMLNYSQRTMFYITSRTAFSSPLIYWCHKGRPPGEEPFRIYINLYKFCQNNLANNRVPSFKTLTHLGITKAWNLRKSEIFVHLIDTVWGWKLL